MLIRAGSSANPLASRRCERPPARRPNDQNFRTALLVSPPVALAIDVFARSVAEIGRADDEDLEALRPRLVAAPCTRRDAHRVPFLELDDLVVELHPPAPAHDHIHLLLLLVGVAVRKAIAGRDALVAQAGLFELERPRRRAELKVRRAVEPRADVLQILLDVPERERQRGDPMAPPRMCHRARSSAKPRISEPGCPTVWRRLRTARSRTRARPPAPGLGGRAFGGCA